MGADPAAGFDKFRQRRGGCAPQVRRTAGLDAAQVTVDGVLLPEPLLRGVAAGKTYRVEVELPG